MPIQTCIAEDRPNLLTIQAFLRHRLIEALTAGPLFTVPVCRRG